MISTYTPPAFGGNTALSFAFNHTNTEVTEFNPLTLSPNRIRRLEEALPETRWNFIANQSVGRMDILGRLSYYGGWFDGDDPEFYSGKPIVDLELSLPLSESTTLAFGSQNVFNTDPGETPFALRNGERYSELHPLGVQRRLPLLRPQLLLGGVTLTPGSARTIAAGARGVRNL